ncbi:hypothetical protein COCON_G00190600 [Conger conger]|uniref:Uncharacterized protein n=1 Tax=Conger conger TaxID=82655 RepID=A0A9Q1HRG5_CONCO|nr:hypothetical protein COCON_G00190600 [Conger conger]
MVTVVYNSSEQDQAEELRMCAEGSECRGLRGAAAPQQEDSSRSRRADTAVLTGHACRSQIGKEKGFRSEKKRHIPTGPLSYTAEHTSLMQQKRSSAGLREGKGVSLPPAALGDASTHSVLNDEVFDSSAVADGEAETLQPLNLDVGFSRERSARDAEALPGFSPAMRSRVCACDCDAQPQTGSLS